MYLDVYYGFCPVCKSELIHDYLDEDYNFISCINCSFSDEYSKYFSDEKDKYDDDDF